LSTHLESNPGRMVIPADATAPFAVNYRQCTHADALASMDEHTLGVVSFSGDGASTDPRDLRVPLEPLFNSGWVEIWSSPLPVERGWADDIGYARNPSVILAQMSVDETKFASFEQATFEAYSRLRRFLEAQGYPHPIRIWNYFSGINEGSGDEERYKQFCLGRANAIQTASNYENRLPAASAIGTQKSGFFIYQLASKDNGIQIENPRQVSAFQYPRQYGAQSPSFSRARLVRWQSERHLYLSGTASVVGHETLHGDDCRGQLQETLRNIDSLLTNTADAYPHLPACGWADLQLLRVYLRNRGDLPMVRSELESRLGPQLPVIYLHGDICRQDLLIEIEGIYCTRP
jgi:chorismate lyase / 3-hydroxybenzoate synthase